MKPGLFLLLVIFPSIPFVRGQENPDSLAVIQYDQIVITANRLPIPLKSTSSAASLVNRDVLRSMARTAAVDEALRLVPGVRIDNQANGSRIHMSIRGQGILSELGIRGIRVFLDGIPLNDPTGFAPDLYDVDWATVDRVEVVRGLSASLYGGSASAGVLNIVTRTGGDGPAETKIFSSTGSNGFAKLLAQVKGRHPNGPDYRISFSRAQGDGYRLHSAFWSNQFSEKIGWAPSAGLKLTQVLSVIGYFNQNAEGLNSAQVIQNPKQPNPDAIPFNEYQKTRRITFGLSGSCDLTGNQELDFTIHYRNADYQEPGSRAVKYRDIRSPGGSVQYVWNLPVGRFRNRLLVGMDMQFQTIDETKTANLKREDRAEAVGSFDETVREDSVLLANQTIDQRGIGVFAMDRLEFGGRWSATLTLRHDDMRNQLTDIRNQTGNLSGKADFEKTTARLGCMVSFSNSANLYANWGQGFLPPATEELASNPKSFGGFNADLTPATSSGYEAGLRGMVGGGCFYDVTLFRMDTRNDFYRYRILPGRPLETFYGNAGASRRHGLESYLSLKVSDRLGLTSAYTWSDFKYTAPDSIRSNRLPNSPEHQWAAELEYTVLRNVTVGLGTELQTKWSIYTDKLHQNVFQEGFRLIHARISYRWEFSGLKGEVGLYGKNLTDQSYMAFTEPDPDGNSYQPAPGREFFVTVTIRY
jgi:iron complex outermembrane receptor protein